MKSYDFYLTRKDEGSHLYTESITRRYLAAFIDFLIIACVFIILGFEGEGAFKGLLNLSLLLIVLFVPEFLWRQTIGMYLCNIVVLVPPSVKPAKALLIRRIVNLIEFSLPFAVYYFVVAFSHGNRSISDRASSCVIARKRYLIEGVGTHVKLSKTKKVVIPLIFTFFPVVLIVSITVVFVLLFKQAGILYDILDYVT